MHKDWPAIAKELSVAIREVRGGAPDVTKAFSAMAKAALEMAVTSPTTTARLLATAAPLSPWVTGKRGCAGAPGPLQPTAAISSSVTSYTPTQRYAPARRISAATRTALSARL